MVAYYTSTVINILMAHLKDHFFFQIFARLSAETWVHSLKREDEQFKHDDIYEIT